MITVEDLGVEMKRAYNTIMDSGVKELNGVASFFRDFEIARKYRNRENKVYIGKDLVDPKTEKVLVPKIKIGKVGDYTRLVCVSVEKENPKEIVVSRILTATKEGVLLCENQNGRKAFYGFGYKTKSKLANRLGRRNPKQ